MRRICYGFMDQEDRVGGERTTCASTASSLNLRRANAQRPLTHSLTRCSSCCLGGGLVGSDSFGSGKALDPRTHHVGGPERLV
jgi:hypothetical protein